MSLTTGTRLGSYEIIAPLGAGGMGEVYRARDTKLGRDVAVKVLPSALAHDTAALGRFEREARAVAALSHPNILAIFDFGTEASVTYAVTELLEGETLRARLASAAGPLPTRKAIEYGVQIGRGIAAAHEKGIIHRDLKPENIFITKDGQVKVLDFGLAKAAGPTGDRTVALETKTVPATDAGTVLGTVGYMSPEQVRGRPLDHRTDIFSFGAILYEMLTGRRAFRGDSYVETMNAILKEDPPEFAEVSPGLPASLDRLVRRCLEKNPDERFYSAHDLSIALEALLGTSSQRAAAVEAAPRPFRVGRLLLPIAAALVVAAAAFFIGRQTVGPRAQEAPDYHRLTFRQGPIYSARFGPDGETIVYSATWEGQQLQVYSTRASSPESAALPFPGSDIASVSSSGELAIIRNKRSVLAYARIGTLARAPLAGGAPRAVLEDVQDADWLPDGSEFVVSHFVNGRYQLEFPIGKIVFETAGYISHPRVSPDGERVAFLDHPLLGDDRGFVAVVDRAGKMRRLTGEYSSTQGLAWKSANEIWFTGSDRGSKRALHAVRLSGALSTIVRVPANMQLGDISADGSVLLWQDNLRIGIAGRLAGDSADRDLSWLDWSIPAQISDDGKLLLFTEEGDGAGAEYGVYLRPTDGGPAVRLGPGQALDLSSDGKWVLALRLNPAPSQLVLLPTGAGEVKPVTNDAITHTGGRFLPDGKRILFTGFESGHRSRVYVQDLQGGMPQPIAPEGYGLVTYGLMDVSPDGLTVLVRGPNGQLAVLSVNGGEPRSRTLPDEAYVFVRWAPDSRSIYVRKKISRATGAVQLFRYNMVTGRVEPLRQIVPIPGSVSAGGIQSLLITPDVSAYFYGYSVALSDLYLVKGLK